jgi:Asp-tRNA(Asn)/Glu-tRNA(Gln) amidotransferase A subunit family amidase
MKFFYLICLILINCASQNLVLSQYFDFKVSSIQTLLKSKKWNCTDVIKYFLDRSTRYNNDIKALISLNPDALEEAVSLDDYFYSTNKFMGRLHCIPVIVKDNIDVAGMPTTGGIRALRYSIPNKNALVIDRMESEGAIIISKANMAELAMGQKYASELGGACMNPFDKTRTCGASSSGSGAGIAAGMGVISLGTDETGSIINPSAYNGIFGLRASQNFPNVDILNGIVPTFDRRDTVGPMAKYLDDLVLAYSIMYNDSASYDGIMGVVDPSKLKIKSITNFWDSLNFQSINYAIDGELKPFFQNSLGIFKVLGMSVFDYSLTNDELAQLANLLKITKDESPNCMKKCLKFSYNRYFSDRDRFQSDAPYNSFDLLYTSPLLSPEWYNFFNNYSISNVITTQECQLGCLMYDDAKSKLDTLVKSWFAGDYDAIVMPSFTNLPPLLNTSPNSSVSMAVLSMITGNPFISIPAGYTSPSASAPDGLPYSIGLLGTKDKIDRIFKIAKLFENINKVVKLPSSTPLLKANCRNGSDRLVFNNGNQMLIILFSLLCVFFRKLF